MYLSIGCVGPIRKRNVEEKKREQKRVTGVDYNVFLFLCADKLGGRAKAMAFYHELQFLVMFELWCYNLLLWYRK